MWMHTPWRALYLITRLGYLEEVVRTIPEGISQHTVTVKHINEETSQRANWTPYTNIRSYGTMREGWRGLNQHMLFHSLYAHIWWSIIWHYNLLKLWRHVRAPLASSKSAFVSYRHYPIAIIALPQYHVGHRLRTGWNMWIVSKHALSKVLPEVF